jgi:carbonic anhydrase
MYGKTNKEQLRLHIHTISLYSGLFNPKSPAKDTKSRAKLNLFERVKIIQYGLLQFHFESEHTVDSQYSALEAHFVHMDEKAQLAALNVFINQTHEGKENKALATILKNASDEVGIHNLQT